MQVLRIVGLVLLVACGDDKKTPPPPDPNGIEVMYAGTEPRRALRYQIGKGDTVEVELSIDVELDASGRGGPLPTVYVGTEIVATDVLPDSSMRVRATITSIRATDVPNSTLSAESMTEHMQLLKGTSLVGTLLPDGGIRDLRAEAAAKLPPALAHQLETVSRSFQQISMPLPHLPIGAGAAWRQRKAIEQNGMKLLAVTTIVMTALDDRGFTFTSSTSLGGANQTVVLQGHQIQMSGIGGVGTGKGTIDLTKMVMTGESTLSFHSDMTAGGETDQMGMTVTTRVAPTTVTKPVAPDAGVVEDLPEPGDDNTPIPDNTEFSGENQASP
ncbi:MAG: hypothetical protein ACKV2T_05380 [Kofleriaceae bacterium]